MSERPIRKWDGRFLDLASSIAAWSKDPSTRCGAVVVAPDRSVVSMGYNGFPRGMKDDEELYGDRELKYERIIHCEMNAVLLAERPVRGCTLYTWPMLSCPRCAVHMIQAGIVRCVAPMVTAERADRWKEPVQRSKEFFREAGVSFTEVDLFHRCIHEEWNNTTREIREIMDDMLK